MGAVKYACINSQMLIWVREQAEMTLAEAASKINIPALKSQAVEYQSGKNS